MKMEVLSRVTGGVVLGPWRIHSQTHTSSEGREQRQGFGGKIAEGKHFSEGKIRGMTNRKKVLYFFF